MNLYLALLLAVTTAPPRDSAVMAWGSSPSDPEQLQFMKQAGLNISGFCRAEDLASR